MKIFLSYATEDRALAEQIQLALAGAGHEVFFDRESLPAGGDYHERIKASVDAAELFVFLVSPDSVAPGGYALTEMGYARARWPHPKGRLIPVLGRPTPFESMPAYLKSVTVLEPVGNTAAEVVTAVERLRAGVQAAPATPPRGEPAAAGATSRVPTGIKLGLAGAAVLLGVAAAVFFAGRGPSDPKQAQLEALIAAATTACVSNTDVENTARVGSNLSLLLDNIKGEGGITEYRRKHVGADRALPSELQLPENEQIRRCMAPYMVGIFEAMGIKVVQAAAGEPQVPNPLQLRFSYQPGGSTQISQDDTLRVNLWTSQQVVDAERLAQQASGYYSYNTAYPGENDEINGSLIREVRASSLNAAPQPAQFCLKRPSQLQPSQDRHVHLDCVESGGCKLHVPSPRWLEPCPPAAQPPQEPRQPRKTSRAFGLFPLAMAAEPTRRWVVPSAKTLAAHQDQLAGVGYTLFEIETDAFRDPQVIGVEVDIAVNGVPILEDALPPRLRPVPNDATQPLRYRFALESLDFEGAQAGCEAIRLTLRPRLAGGKTGEPLALTLAYVALRDSAEQSLPFGKGNLSWSAKYVIPSDEWSHEAFVGSVTYAAGGGEAAAAEARKRIVAMKRAFDALGIHYQGRPVVGVIRPPLTLERDRLAYGLTSAVVQPSGQVRFTFSPQEANAIADALLAARADSAAARAVIGGEKYLYRVAGTAQRRETPTPPGVCRHVKAQ